MKAAKHRAREHNTSTSSSNDADAHVRRRASASQEMENASRELVDWMSKLLDEKLDGPLMEILQDGILLCRLVERISSNVKVTIMKKALPGTFQARDNIDKALRGFDKLGLDKMFLFDTNDLINRKEKTVVTSLLNLARLAYTRYHLEPPDSVRNMMNLGWRPPASKDGLIVMCGEDEWNVYESKGTAGGGDSEDESESESDGPSDFGGTHSALPDPQAPDYLLQLHNFLTRGGRLRKYGRSGKGHMRHVKGTSRSGSSVLDTLLSAHMDAKGNPTEQASKAILSDVLAISEGKKSLGFQHILGQVKNVPDETCFSVIMKDGRTLDFQAGSARERDAWVQAVQMEALRSRGEEVPELDAALAQQAEAEAAAARDAREREEQLKRDAAEAERRVLSDEFEREKSGWRKEREQLEQQQLELEKEKRKLAKEQEELSKQLDAQKQQAAAEMKQLEKEQHKLMKEQEELSKQLDAQKQQAAAEMKQLEKEKHKLMKEQEELSKKLDAQKQQAAAEMKQQEQRWNEEKASLLQRLARGNADSEANWERERQALQAQLERAKAEYETLLRETNELREGEAAPRTYDEMMEEFFYLEASSCMRLLEEERRLCLEKTVNVQELLQLVKDENIAFYKWHDWLRMKLLHSQQM